MKKFKILTLGCRTNQYESAAYADQLHKMGYAPAKEDEEADLCVLNTCTVTRSAEVRSKAKLRQLLSSNPKAKILVTGCMVEQSPDELKQEGLITIVPNKQKEKLLQVAFPEEKHLPEFSICNFEAHTRAFVKVQDGCNSFCSYCIIPYVRGRSRCRPITEVLVEVKNLLNNGYKEIVLTGINIGDYKDGDKNLADLIRAVDQMEGLKRLRVSSIDADEVDEDLAGAILQGKNTCPSMHIVLQSGSNVILKKMNRKYTRQIFFSIIEKLQKQRPDFTVTTDIIVGFPGESETDFLDTLDAVKKVRFAKVHMFPYSPRERTKAFFFQDRVEDKVIQERKSMLLREAEKVSFDLRQEYVGTQREVLLEQREGDYISGHTDNFLRVKIKHPFLRQNEIVSVFLKENLEDGLLGEIL